MGDDEAVGLAAVLVDNNEVGDVVGACDAHEVVDDMAAAVHALRAREQQAHLLGKHLEAAAGVARRGDDDLGRGAARRAIFVVAATGGGGGVRRRVVKRYIPA